MQVDGTLVIFDIETYGVARKLRGHTRQIQSLRWISAQLFPNQSLTQYSWSQDGRYLLSSGQDGKSILWDLKNGARLRTVRFEAPIYIAELHPSNQWVLTLLRGLLY